LTSHRNGLFFDDLQNLGHSAPHRTVLGWHLLQMVRHLDQHKGQLFYYLKLQGEPVNTADLWG